MSQVKRVKNVSVEKAVVTGTAAFWLGKVDRKPDEHSHKWTVYLRGANNEDLSYFIKKVTFQLYQTYENPQRVVDSAPFEVTETGWGEFEVGIKIQFHDPAEKPAQLYHLLRLFPQDGTPPSTTKPVVVEHYDEIVFNDPTETFYRKLLAGTGRKARTSLLPYFTTFNEAAELKKIREVHQCVLTDIKVWQVKAEQIEKEAGMTTSVVAKLLEPVVEVPESVADSSQPETTTESIPDPAVSDNMESEPTLDTETSLVATEAVGESQTSAMEV